MGIKRSLVNSLHAFAFSKSGLPYGYGGQFSRTNPRASTDCSGVVGAASMYLATGNDANLYVRHGSTESWRLDADGRYAGLTKVSHPSQIPADAVLRAGFQHGGGGEYSHTACTIEHANWESRGTPGVLYGSSARAWNDGLFTEYWYMAGPVDNDLADHVFPLPDGFYYGPYEGPENSISGKSGEHQHWRDGLKRWQSAAGIVADGVYGSATASKARELQRAAGFALVDGIVGVKTWPLAVKAGSTGGPVVAPDPLATMTAEQRVLHELTYRFRTRVADSGYTDTLVGYMLNVDKSTYLAQLEQERQGIEQVRQGKLLDAVAAKLGVAV